MTRVRSLEVIIDMDKIVPQTHPYTMTNNLVEKVFGGKIMMVVGLTANQDTIFKPEILEKIKIISTKAAEIPGVVNNSVFSIATRKAKNIVGNEEGMVVSRLMDKVPQTAKELSELENKVVNDPLLRDVLISNDKKTTQIIFEVKPLPSGVKQTVDDIKKVVEEIKDDTVRVTLGGGPLFLALAEKFSKRMGILFPLALLIIGLIHYEAFRTWQALFLPLATALLAVVWALGGLALMKQPLDVFNSATPILVLAIAAGHAVQILKRYYEDFAVAKKSNPNMSGPELNRTAVQTSLTTVGPVMVIACLVAAIGFFSLIIFDIKTIQTFGIFTGIGVLSALCLELTFIPALRSLLPAPKERELSREKARSFWDKLVEKFFILATEKRNVMFVTTVVIVAVLSLGGFWLKVENSQRLFYDPDSPERVDDAYLSQQMAGTSAIYVAILGDSPDSMKDPAVLSGIAKIQEQVNKDPNVGKTLSIADFVKKMNQALNNGDPKHFSIPETKDMIAQTLFLYTNSGDPGDFDSYVDSDYQKALIKVFLKGDHSVVVNRVFDIIRKTAKEELPANIEYHLGGGAATGVSVNEVMVKEKLLNIIQIMGAVFIITSLIFRSLLAGFLILVPLIAAVLVNFGVMGLLGIPLQLGTAMVSAMAIGVGADYGIYLSFRLREELKKGTSEEEAFRKAYASAGKAILFVSSAIAGGFGVLMFSRGFLPHIWMGGLIGLATVVSAVTTLTIFPAAILKLRAKYIFGDSKKKSQTIER